MATCKSLKREIVEILDCQLKEVETYTTMDWQDVTSNHWSGCQTAFVIHVASASLGCLDELRNVSIQHVTHCVAVGLAMNVFEYEALQLVRALNDCMLNMAL